MTIEEFINRLENDQITPASARSYLKKLTKENLIKLLTFKPTIDTEGTSILKKLNTDSSNQIVSRQMVEKRISFFERNEEILISIINNLNEQEISEFYNIIPEEFSYIKNLLLRRQVLLVHDNQTDFDYKSIIAFKSASEDSSLTEEEIRKKLLTITKEEFSYLICLGEDTDYFNISYIGYSDAAIDSMIDNNQEIIADILECYTEEELTKLIPLINHGSKRIRAMLFKCLGDKKASELFLTNAPKYSSDMFSFLATPSISDERDELIAKILTDPNLYSLYTESDLISLKASISNMDTPLYDGVDLLNTKEEDIIKEAVRYIANLRGRDNDLIKIGILKKLSSKKLHDLVNEVNIGLKNIKEEPITFEEFITLMDMPLDKAIFFLRECYELTNEEKVVILSKLYNITRYQGEEFKDIYLDTLNLYKSSIIRGGTIKPSSFAYCFKELLELPYDNQFYESIKKQYISLGLENIDQDCFNIFIAQLIGNRQSTMNTPFQVEFYIGKAILHDRPNQPIHLSTYDYKSNHLLVNLAAYKNNNSVSRKIAAIENIYHEIRLAYQYKVESSVGTIRDLYFLLDIILHDSEHSCELDAKLQSLIGTKSILQSNPKLHDSYWLKVKDKASELAHQRKITSLGINQDSNVSKDLIDIFFKSINPFDIKNLRDIYPMLELITDEEGYELFEEDLINSYFYYEEIYKTEELSPSKVEELEATLQFLKEYLARRCKNQKLANRKLPI